MTSKIEKYLAGYDGLAVQLELDADTSPGCRAYVNLDGVIVVRREGDVRIWLGVASARRLAEWILEITRDEGATD